MQQGYGKWHGYATDREAEAARDKEAKRLRDLGYTVLCSTRTTDDGTMMYLIDVN